MGIHEERTRREISLLYAEAVTTEERIRVDVWHWQEARQQEARRYVSGLLLMLKRW